MYLLLYTLTNEQLTCFCIPWWLLRNSHNHSKQLCWSRGTSKICRAGVSEDQGLELKAQITTHVPPSIYCYVLTWNRVVGSQNTCSLQLILLQCPPVCPSFHNFECLYISIYRHVWWKLGFITPGKGHNLLFFTSHLQWEWEDLYINMLDAQFHPHVIRTEEVYWG